MHYKGSMHGKNLKALCNAIHRNGELRAILDQGDTIYMTGISGMTVGMCLACKYEVPFAVLRKPGEQSHGAKLQGYLGDWTRILIVDDFVSSGQTIFRMLKEANLLDPEDAARVTVFLYDQERPPTWTYLRQDCQNYRNNPDKYPPYGYDTIEEAEQACAALEAVTWVTL